ncbi:MAG TPA: TrmH family RNA methyltransferase [Anaerolineales bacterium]|nr:TrmH family RNA methyltransferase [Anaerolineales bacterium]
MPTRSYEIRVCSACGLRYPLVEGHPFGPRCPVCMADTQVVHSRALSSETAPRDDQKEGSGKTMAVLLDNIRSGWNVGSILRSADGFGFSHAYLCGITPTADNEAVTKTSLGAEDSVPWSYHRDAVKLVKGLKTGGWRVYGLEESVRALDISHAERAIDSVQRKLLIIGNEVTGVDPELLDLCDQVFFIPMRGEKRSFNVAIAFSIAAYALSIQNMAH